MSWWFLALLAAIIWGLHYPLIDHALEKLSIPSILFLTTAPVVIIFPFYYQELRQDFNTFLSMGISDKLLTGSIALTSLTAAVCVYAAIGAKNATLASLIEISYPLFVVIGSLLILRENHLEPSVIAGGLMIFAGVITIVWNSQ